MEDRSRPSSAQSPTPEREGGESEGA
jgi:hypothetical protein